MKIFLSHSIADKELIANIQKVLEPYGLVFFIAEHKTDLEHNITEKVELIIRKADVGLVLLTENGFNSHFVQQEIGYLKSLKKPFIQVVQIGIEKSITGFNFGRDYIPFDPKKSDEAIEKLKEILLTFYKKLIRQKELIRKTRMQEKRRQQFVLRQKLIKEKNQREANVAFGVLAGLLILGALDN